MGDGTTDGLLRNSEILKIRKSIEGIRIADRRGIGTKS